ncbi:MAG: DUF523 and DUF1722 domain-containing protein [Acidobacteria bacterium]|jgi:uncharacterized protein YbgA (DUF1722 family)/uncharacterized protein YbbK (DUF523 family)|nr:DUF523 and DUF1722 domain-containing protein [Acidobacteriota bacterium]
MEKKIRLGISSCLLGNKVRYDGGHKFDPFLVNTLGQFVEYVPVCPEVESGFPVPREAFRLVGDPERPRLVTRQTGVDATPQMERWIEKKLPQLEKEEMCGFIFKSQSPSSGMERVKVYNDKGMAEKKGVGVFARALMARLPLLPVEEEGRLQDIDLRENFIVRIFVYRRWREMLSSGAAAGRLVEFQRRHKLLLMAHSPEMARQLGKLVAGAGTRPLTEIVPEYEKLFLTALKQKATVRKNVNVLQHMLGYFKKQLDDFEKRELLRVIEEYRQSLVPLIVPLTLLKHYIDKFREPYLKDQYYLDPHPLELKLRNHA